MGWRDLLARNEEGVRPIESLITSIMSKKQSSMSRRERAMHSVDAMLFDHVVSDTWKKDGGSISRPRLSHTFSCKSEAEAIAIQDWFENLKKEMEKLATEIPSVATDNKREILTNLRPDGNDVKVTFASRGELQVAREYLSVRNRDQELFGKPTKADLKKALEQGIQDGHKLDSSRASQIDTIRM